MMGALSQWDLWLPFCKFPPCCDIRAHTHTSSVETNVRNLRPPPFMSPALMGTFFFLAHNKTTNLKTSKRTSVLRAETPLDNGTEIYVPTASPNQKKMNVATTV